MDLRAADYWAYRYAETLELHRRLVREAFSAQAAADVLKRLSARHAQVTRLRQELDAVKERLAQPGNAWSLPFTATQWLCKA
jgi:hypothetical protein